jgi:metal-responsive CopG/Arc/MetJ family transcriptional regulator
MRDPKLQKITASVTLEVGQLERLNEAADRARVSRSVIVRDAIERELKRYEKPNEVGDALQKERGTIVPKTAPKP